MMKTWSEYRAFILAVRFSQFARMLCLRVCVKEEDHNEISLLSSPSCLSPVRLLAIAMKTRTSR